MSQIPDAVDTVVCAPDDGWIYHPKHVEQFPNIIYCVTLHLVGYIYWNIVTMPHGPMNVTEKLCVKNITLALVHLLVLLCEL